MNNQEVFDAVVNHLRAQNKKCLNVAGHCVYRNGEGDKCAIGSMIPDEVYEIGMEQKMLSTLVYHWEGLKHLDPFSDLLGDLRHVHDAEKVENWEKAFQAVAKSYNLNYTPKDAA